MTCDYTDPERCAVDGWTASQHKDERFAAAGHVLVPAHLPVVCGWMCGVDQRFHPIIHMDKEFRNPTGEQHDFQPVHIIPDPEGYEGTAKVPCGAG